ncbi:hypothetical protein D3C81_1611350 [compost metagenome]
MLVGINILTVQQEQQGYNIFLLIQCFQQRLQRSVNKVWCKAALRESLHESRFIIHDHLIKIIVQTMTQLLNGLRELTGYNRYILYSLPDQQGDFFTLDNGPAGQYMQAHTIESVSHKTIAGF